jgi:hypothetical protein
MFVKNKIKKRGDKLTLEEFFEEEEIIAVHGIYKYKDRRKRCKIPKRMIVPQQTPYIIKDICSIIKFLRKNGLSITQIDYPVLAAIIQRYLGYGKTWSYIITSSIIQLYLVFG